MDITSQDWTIKKKPGDTNSAGPSNHLKVDRVKQQAVVDAFKHAWGAYERNAMGSDEFSPHSGRGMNFSIDGGIGYTVVDALDTMYLMGLKAEYSRARDWIQDSLSFDRRGQFSTFETTIRVLGGLLSAYYLTSDPLYRSKAIDLAERIYPVFESGSVLPASHVNLAIRKGAPGTASIAEVGTLQLEFKYAAELSGNTDFWYRSESVMSTIKKALPGHKLAPIFMEVSTGSFTNSEIRLGSNGDSYYEYLLKQYLQTARTEPIYKKMYEDAMQGIHENMIRKTPKKELTYISQLSPTYMVKGVVKWHNGNRQEHLVCFLAGSLMLGATTTGAVSKTVSVPPLAEELTAKGRRDWSTGTSLLESCMRTHETATGLSPEVASFGTDPSGSDRDWFIDGSGNSPPPYDARYMLRPETVESLFLAWRLTGDERYRTYAWKIFTAIETHCKVKEGGYATVLHVDKLPVRLEDKQETFFLSETLKYLYLIFSDSSLLPLDEIVFNTEAHPLPIFKPTIKPKFS
ncbi:seven-hairpin glycosidase [Marasmius fiardii PR-910]|nr:seven-hairpin glycosidase [Marasmius fiardii PR-910]